MKKRLLAFLLAVSMAVSMLALPAAAAGNANTAVQLSITLDGMDSTQTAALNAVVTRGAFARMLLPQDSEGSGLTAVVAAGAVCAVFYTVFVYGNVPGMTFAFAGLYFQLRWQRGGKAGWMLLSGACTALSIWLKTFGLIFPVNSSPIPPRISRYAHAAQKSSI